MSRPLAPRAGRASQAPRARRHPGPNRQAPRAARPARPVGPARPALPNPRVPRPAGLAPPAPQSFRPAGTERRASQSSRPAGLASRGARASSPAKSSPRAPKPGCCVSRETVLGSTAWLHPASASRPTTLHTCEVASMPTPVAARVATRAACYGVDSYLRRGMAGERLSRRDARCLPTLPAQCVMHPLTHSFIRRTTSVAAVAVGNPAAMEHSCFT